MLTDAQVLPAPPSFAVPATWPGHAAGCACCAPRSGVAVTLAGMFRARATGVPFEAVLADVLPAAAAAIRAALDGDVVVAARFRLVVDGAAATPPA